MIYRDKFLAAISGVAIILIAAGAGVLIIFGEAKTTPAETPTPKPSGNRGILYRYTQ